MDWYGEDWNFRHHRPIDALTEQAARDRYEAGGQLVVGVCEPSRPEVVIEVHWNNQYLGVWFFDELRRQSTKFQFTRHGNDQLFLASVIGWQYPGDSARGLITSILVDEFRFETDGRAKRITRDDIAREATTQERTGVDVSTNWERVPAFGDWRSLTRFERNQAEATQPRDPSGAKSSPPSAQPVHR